MSTAAVHEENHVDQPDRELLRAVGAGESKVNTFQFGQQGRHLLRARAEHEIELSDILQQQRHADRGDQHVEPRCIAERSIGQSLDDNSR